MTMRPPDFRRWQRFFALLGLCLPLGVGAQPVAPEADLKAAILVNMLLFVDWPANGAQAVDRMTLCHFGSSPVSDALLRLDGRSVKERRVSVLRTDATRLESCHMAYLSSDDSAHIEIVADVASKRGILLAGDTPGYLARGIMLNLELSGGRVVFDVDLRAARQAGLLFSSKVLRLARRVLD